MDKDSNLHRDLLDNILLRLSYKSVSQLRCVSKFWKSLLTAASFQSLYLSNFIKHHTFGDRVFLRLSFYTTYNRLRVRNCKLFPLCTNDDSSAIDTLPRIDMFGPKFRILGHFNGIVCLLAGSGTRDVLEVILYNPLTTESKYLPHSVTVTNSFFSLAVGMGYDTQSDDYKVVRILSEVRNSEHANCVEEYSLNTDSWTPLDNSNSNNFSFVNDSFALFFRGIYYWWAFSRGRERSSMILLGLNMGDQVFHEVPVPRGVHMFNSCCGHLAVWNDSISLIYCRNSNEEIPIWVRNGNGDQAPWNRILTITTESLLRQEPKPLVFWKGNELLLQVSSGEIKSYNVGTGEIENLKIAEHPVHGSAQAINYEPTLVSIKGGRYLT